MGRGRSYRFAVTGAALLTMLAVSCGGGSDPAEGDGFDGVIVESSDGLASLLVPTGALPEGVTASEISIEPIEAEGEPASDGVQTIASYRLLPDGLELDTPATLRLPLGEPADGVYAVWHLTDDSEELVELELAESGDAIEVSVEHFSDVVLQDLTLALGEFLKAQIELEGGYFHGVGLPFSVTGSTTRQTPATRIDFKPPKGGSMEAQLRGDPALNSIAIFGGEPLTPDERRGSGVPLPDPFEAEFECAAVGGAELQLAARFGVLMDYVRVTPNGTLRERDGASGQVLLRALALARCTAEAPVASVTAVATSTLPPAATATEPPRLATPTPPEGYGPCQNSPTQEADFCSPTVQITGTRQVFGPERLELLTLRVQLAAAPPAKPDHFVGFNVIITPEAPGTNPIERLLSAFSGEEYRCTQGQEGLDLPLRPGEVCGELAGGTLTMIFDLSTYQGSSVAIDIFSIETGAPDGLRRGDALRTPGVKVPCC